jgi:hypothetical protein
MPIYRTTISFTRASITLEQVKAAAIRLRGFMNTMSYRIAPPRYKKSIKSCERSDVEQYYRGLCLTRDALIAHGPAVDQHAASTGASRRGSWGMHYRRPLDPETKKGHVVERGLADPIIIRINSPSKKMHFSIDSMKAPWYMVRAY